MDEEGIIFEKREHVGYVTIKHPPANTWDLLTTEQFQRTIQEVELDRDVRVVVITGSGEKFFSAGFDVKDVTNAHKTSPMARALDMVLFSKTVDANQALEMGLVDKIEGTKRFLECFAETVMGHLILQQGLIVHGRLGISLDCS